MNEATHDHEVAHPAGFPFVLAFEHLAGLCPGAAVQS
jgi:hypothetical protein